MDNAPRERSQYFIHDRIFTHTSNLYSYFMPQFRLRNWNTAHPCDRTETRAPASLVGHQSLILRNAAGMASFESAGERCQSAKTEISTFFSVRVRHFTLSGTTVANLLKSSFPHNFESRPSSFLPSFPLNAHLSRSRETRFGRRGICRFCFLSIGEEGNMLNR